MSSTHLRRFVPYLVACLALVVFGLAGEVATSPQSGAAYAQSDPCTIARIAPALKREPRSISAAEARQLVSWCKQQEELERKATPARTVAGKDPAKTAFNLQAVPASTAIWCGKNACTCWKGKRWDGCHHTNKLCATALHCFGRICGCQAAQ